ASLTPWRLATSATVSLSVSRRILTICSSLYRVFFICLSLSKRPLSQVTLDRKSRDRSHTGSYPNIDNLRQVGDGITRDQLYDLLGRPHFAEGFRVREWDYLFH